MTALAGLDFYSPSPGDTAERVRGLCGEVLSRLPGNAREQLLSIRPVLIGSDLHASLGGSYPAESPQYILLAAILPWLARRRAMAVVAHEFAHVILRHCSPNDDAEAEADSLVSSWGFAGEMRAIRRTAPTYEESYRDDSERFSTWVDSPAGAKALGEHGPWAYALRLSSLGLGPEPFIIHRVCGELLDRMSAGARQQLLALDPLLLWQDPYLSIVAGWPPSRSGCHHYIVLPALFPECDPSAAMYCLAREFARLLTPDAETEYSSAVAAQDLAFSWVLGEERIPMRGQVQ